MDRDELLNLLTALQADEVVARPDGTLVTDDGSEYRPEDVQPAVAELTADLAKLIQWAKLAPKYRPPPVTTRNEAGKLCDESGLPL